MHGKKQERGKLRKILSKIKKYRQGKLNKEELFESFQGWNAYARWADTLELRRSIARKIYNRY